MLKQCPKCMHDQFPIAVFLDRNFCFNCGTQLEPCPKCVRCGIQLTPSDKFCVGCGLPREQALSKPTEM